MKKTNKEKTDEPLRRLFFTSDLLFFGTDTEGYERCDAENRFNAIRDEWNKSVTDDDIVFVLGNFCCDPKECKRCVDELNGSIVLLPTAMDKNTITGSARMVEYLVSQGDYMAEKGSGTFKTLWYSEKINLLHSERYWEYIEHIIEKMGKSFIISRDTVLELPTHSLVLSTWRMAEWNGCGAGVINVYGGEQGGDERSFNVRYGVTGMTPVPYREIIKLNLKRKK